MATLADELLADLMDDDSDFEDQDDSNLPEDIENDDGAEKTTFDNDAEMKDADAVNAVAEAEDEAEAKARVEKINFAAIGDVRSVANLMKSLKPVLEVSFSSSIFI
jgi:U4/U6 small nuclear ribonucleoprotein PRP31